LEQQYRPTLVKIHLGHIQRNFELFKSIPSAQYFMCPMVKANAYGHDDIHVSEALKEVGCTTFGVGLVEEGIRLRTSGLTHDSVLVFGFSGREAVEEMSRHLLTPVVSDWEQLESIKAFSKGSSAIHLKFNSGMNRLGFSLSDLQKLETFFKDNRAIKVVGCGTHLMTSEDLNSDAGESAQQMSLFAEIVKNPLFRGCALHAFNTSGAVHLQQHPHLAQKHPYGLRIGLGIYGYASVHSDFSRKLYPAMSFLSRIVTVQKVKKNGRVSYGGTWAAKKDSIIGVVPAGYADGIPTQLSNCGTVLVGQFKAPIVGRVCMDYTLIDVTEIPDALHSEVEFFGVNHSAETVAEHAKTITYDILTRISERVPRVFVRD
jgi:alanine racemase